MRRRRDDVAVEHSFFVPALSSGCFIDRMVLPRTKEEVEVVVAVVVVVVVVVVVEEEEEEEENISDYGQRLQLLATERVEIAANKSCAQTLPLAGSFLIGSTSDPTRSMDHIGYQIPVC